MFQIDRMYDWQRNPSGSVRDTLKRQKPNTKSEFDERAKQTIAEFAEQVTYSLLNLGKYWKDADILNCHYTGFECCLVLGEGRLC